MPNENLINSLQTRKESNETGLIMVTRPDGTNGSISLSEGDIVYACTDSNIKNLAAVYLMLAWPEASVSWSMGVNPQKVSCCYEIDMVIIQYLKLEAECDTPDFIVDNIQNASHRRVQRKNNTLYFPNLQHSKVFFENADPADHPIYFELTEGNVLIGSSSDCDLVIQGYGVSRHHCRALVTKTSIILSDLGSKNGTNVNGTPIRKQAIIPGDVVTLTNCQLRLQAEKKMKIQTAIPWNAFKDKPQNTGADSSDAAKPKVVTEIYDVAFWEDLLEK